MRALAPDPRVTAAAAYARMGQERPPSQSVQSPVATTTPSGLAMSVLAPRITQTIGEMVILTSPAWGALLLSRLLR